MNDPYADVLPAEATATSDEKAKSIADTPLLTGDPEWDAIELMETDPTRPPLRERLQVDRRPSQGRR